MSKRQLGRVCINIGYIVDINDKDMIDNAKAFLVSEIINLAKRNVLEEFIDVEDAPDAHENSIPEFLLNPHEMIKRKD